jgi:hypothetical protein
MRESRTYGSVRGARDETRVPTATDLRCCGCSRQLLALRVIRCGAHDSDAIRAMRTWSLSVASRRGRSNQVDRQALGTRGMIAVGTHGGVEAW